MTPERWARVGDVFEAVVDRSPDEHDAALEELCGGDDEVRREVERLLEADDGRDTFLEEVVAGGVDLWTEGRNVRRRIGSYRLLRRLGYGGMGVVYLAEHAEREYERRVAIKAIRPGLDSAAILERFRAERQILASLEHPNIARLLDGGTTEDGGPYLVMEYVDGAPIDRYCDQRCLGIAERLELFRTVCDAVQYAHQHLVVHRDLKPSNILVTFDGVVKLLDFGIARLLSPAEALAGAEPTLTADRPLTLSYASPEQVRGERVTMASDVYSLGVVLFELLTGSRPFDLATVPPHEAARRVLESQRPAPSAAVAPAAANGDGKIDADEVSRRRSTRPDRLRRALRGDLDVIVLKAIHKEGGRRFGSAAQLSEDLRRHLAGRPVQARPDSFSYRASKFVGRHRWPLLAAVVFLVLVTASWINSTLQARRIAEERDKAQQVADFMVGVFTISDPVKHKGETVTARELLDEGAARVDRELADQPLVWAQMIDAIGRAYRELGLPERARSLVERALSVRRRELGEVHLDVAESLMNLGRSLERAGDYVSAEEHLREALAIYLQLSGANSEPVADVRGGLGLVLQAQGRYDEAEDQVRRSLALYRALHGEIDAGVATATGNLAMLVEERGQLDEAELLMRRALELSREVFGESHAEVAQQINNLATQRATRGSLDEAESLHRQALAMRRKVLDPLHPEIQESLNNLAFVLFQKGDYPAAESTFREALELARARLGEDHPQVSAITSNLGTVLQTLGRFDDAVVKFREALEGRRRQLGPEHPAVAQSLSNLAAALSSLGRLDEAVQLTEKALELRRKIFGDEHTQVAQSLSNLAELHLRRGAFDRALALRSSAHEIYRRSFGDEHPKVARGWASLGSIHHAAGRYGEAREVYLKAVDLQRRLYDAPHPNLALSLTGLGEVLVDLGESEPAQRALEEALEIRRRSLGSEHWRTAETRSALGACLAAQGRFDEAEIEMRESLEALEEKRGADHELTRKARRRLIDLYDSAGGSEKARKLDDAHLSRR